MVPLGRRMEQYGASGYPKAENSRCRPSIRKPKTTGGLGRQAVRRTLDLVPIRLVTSKRHRVSNHLT